MLVGSFTVYSRYTHFIGVQIKHVTLALLAITVVLQEKHLPLIKSNRIQ